MIQELMKTAECRNRIEMDDQMRQKQGARVEASANVEPMSEERGEDQMDQGASGSSKNRDDAAAQGRSGSGSEQQFFSLDGDRQRRHCGSKESQIRKHGSRASRACRTSGEEIQGKFHRSSSSTSKQSTREKTLQPLKTRKQMLRAIRRT